MSNTEWLILCIFPAPLCFILTVSNSITHLHSMLCILYETTPKAFIPDLR